MRVVANILAHILSLVFYPLFVPTYGIALFCYAFQCPMVWSAVAIIGTVLLTCVLPMTAIGIMIHKGKVKDIQISNAAERTLPYLYSTIGFLFLPDRRCAGGTVVPYLSSRRCDGGIRHRHDHQPLLEDQRAPHRHRGTDRRMDEFLCCG